MGVQESKRAPEAERILVGSGIGAEAKEWSRLWQAEGGEGPFQTEGKKKRGSREEDSWEMVKRCFMLLPNKYSCASTVHHAAAMQCDLEGHRRGCKVWKGPVRRRSWRPYPEFCLKSKGKAAFDVFLSRGITSWDPQCSKFPCYRACILRPGREPELHQLEQASKRPLQTAWGRDDDSSD